MRRWPIVIAGTVLAAWLGAVQAASTAAYGDLAAVPSAPAALHAAAPSLLRPLLGDARARAAAAIHTGDLPAASALLAPLGDDAETADLRGRLALAQGDHPAAIDAFVRAGDAVRAQTLIDALAATDPARALADQRRLAAGLGDDPRAGEVRGQAWWRLGQLQAAAGYRDPARRMALWRDAEASYERALALAPNEETYLLAAGYQSFANGDVTASRRFYERASRVVPNAPEPPAGLAWLDARAGDCALARTNLARARALFAASAAAHRDPADDPIGGPALRRCAP